MRIFTFLAFTALFLLVSAQKSPFKKFLKKTAFVYIPSGTFDLEEKPISVNAFFMLDHEVTNFEYREYIHTCYLAKGDTAGAIAALPDTSAWNRDSLTFNQPFVNHYFNHPSYYNYPVVNVSKANAKKYCIWLTEIIRKTYPESTFNDFRLPTKAEWIYAAKGGLKDSPYPWGGAYTKNAKGCYLANFNSVGDHNITSGENGAPKVVGQKKYRLDAIDDLFYGPVSMKSYLPNGFKLYNMAGNVAELISDENIAMGGHWQSFGNDIQVTSEIEFLKANPMVGFRPIMSYSGK